MTSGNFAAESDEKRPLLQPGQEAAKDTLLPSKKDTSVKQHRNCINDEICGYLYVVASSLGFSGAALFVRLATSLHGFPVSATVFLRGIVQTTLALLAISMLCRVRDVFHGLTRRQWLLLVLRGCFGGSAMVFGYLSVSLLPLGVQTSLKFTST